MTIINCYINESSVRKQKGLFANRKIKKGSVIIEFKGKVVKSSDYYEGNGDRKKIQFDDGHVLICNENCMAIHCNDAINFNVDRRKLVKSLLSDEPFYKIHPNASHNAYIKNCSRTHRCLLIAIKDIDKDEEIFCHYGFNYWFMKELTEKGFLYEEELENKDFNDDLLYYKGFVQYLKHFYPEYNKIIPIKKSGKYIIELHFDGNYQLQIPIIEFRSYIEKIYV